MLSQCVINRRRNRETPREKTTSVDEKEKDEVKLYAALVLNITSGQLTNLEGINSTVDVTKVSTTE